MPAWKVLLIGLFSVICLSLATATVLVPMAHEGNDRWAWFGGLLPATLVAGGLFALFLRSADRAMDAQSRRH